MTDLFGNPDTPAPAPVREKKAPLKERILEYFKDRKYQSFTASEVVAAFAESKPESVARAVQLLTKSRHIIGTGNFRGGVGVDKLCLTLNLHRK